MESADSKKEGFEEYMMTEKSEGSAEANKKLPSWWRIGHEIITFAVCASWLLLVEGTVLWGANGAIAAYTFLFTICFFGTIIFLFIVELIARNIIYGTDDIQIDKDDKVYLKFESIKLAILRGWGKIFRTLFISFVGIAGYRWINPQPIENVPFLDLTLRQFFSNLFAFLLGLGCVVWLFTFPKQMKTENPDENPYVTWGRAGNLFLALIAMVIFLGGVLIRY